MLLYGTKKRANLRKDLPLSDLREQRSDSAPGIAAKTDDLLAKAARKTLVSRVSLSLPEELLAELDAMVGERGFSNRSQAVAKMLQRSLVKHRHDVGDRVMVGTIMLYYDHSFRGLQKDLATLQHDNIAEVISSLHVHLENHRTLEVVLVQGPADTLQSIADQMIARRGVISGHLELAAAIIPQLHPFRVSGNR